MKEINKTVKRHTLVNAIRIASEEYAKIAINMAGSENPGEKSLASQFEQQALEAIDLAMELENFDLIRLED